MKMPVDQTIASIDALDVSLFQHVASQTSGDDRRSLLAIHRSVARLHREFSYLEIGSHLGGTIQPYLRDKRCTRIFSIDPRPNEMPDDRAPGYRSVYPDNSTLRMLEGLRKVDPEQISKIRCFDLDASKVDVGAIHPRPQIAFIDGEHTYHAARSDFEFCNGVIAPGGVIAFHDYPTIKRAALDIVRVMRHQNRAFVAARLAGSVFAIFLDPAVVAGDSFLADHARFRNNRFRHDQIKSRIKRILPSFLVDAIRLARRTS